MAISTPAKAFGPDTANAAPIAVMVVPMFAPIVIGNACSSLRTPAAANGTIIDVVIELDCTMTVTMTPITIANTALEPSALSTAVSMREITKERINFTISQSATKISAALIPTKKKACPHSALNIASAELWIGVKAKLNNALNGLSYVKPPIPTTTVDKNLAVLCR